MTSLVVYEPLVNECIEMLVRHFEEISQKITTIDMGHWLQCYAFDVIGMITVKINLSLLRLDPAD